MSRKARRLQRATQQRPQPSQKPSTVKAASISQTDADLMAMTIANQSRSKVRKAESYWYCYIAHPWVRACVNVIANAIAQEGFSVAKKDVQLSTPLGPDDDKRVAPLYEFFDTAFPGGSFRSAMVALSQDLDVFGAGYWVKKRDQRNGKTLCFERLNPRLVDIKVTPDGTAIDKFVLRRAAEKNGVIVGGDTLGSIEIEAKDVIFFKMPGGDPITGAPALLESLDWTVALDINVKQQRSAYFANGTKPGTIYVNKSSNEDEVRAAFKSIQAKKVGASNAYSDIILTGDWEINETKAAGKDDVDFVKGSQLSLEEICAVFSVPPSKLRNVAGSMGQSGKGEDDDAFQEECVLPREEIIYEQLTAAVLRDELGYTDIKLVPTRRSALRLDRFQAAMNLVKFGGTGNEARQLVGLPAIENDEYDMDAPLFVGHTEPTVADDEPTDAQPAGEQSGIQTPDVQAQADEVAQSGQKGKRSNAVWY